MLNGATLYILAGLPGSGKTTLAELLARRIGAAHLRIDTIEQALRELCSMDVQGEGYRLAYRLASDILRTGVSVVADSCNPIELTRREWEQVASDAGARHVNIEVICSDTQEHRRRVETRTPTVPGLRMPTWQEVASREYHDWTVERIVLDTSRRPEVECIEELLSKLSAEEVNVMATRRISIGPTHLSFAGCMRWSRKAQICVYGEGRLELCVDSCRYAVANDFDAILMGRYEVLGQLVHCETSRSAAGKRVTLIMPNRTRHRTRTNSRGTFRFVVEPAARAKQGAFSIKVNFGRMESTTEAKEVVLYAEFTDSFRRTHPDVKVDRPLAAKFRGRTINS